MSSIFEGKTGLRSQYMEAAFGVLASASSAAAAYQIGSLTKSGKFLYVDNTLDKDLIIALCHPDADATVAANRLTLLEVPAGRVMSLDVSSTANLEIDPGTKIFLYRASGSAPTTGKFRMFSWG